MGLNIGGNINAEAKMGAQNRKSILKRKKKRQPQLSIILL